MLIISRRRGERIKIGEDIEIVVTEITRQGVRLGISAPSTTPILRSEVLAAVEAANRAAATSELETPSGAPPVAGVMPLRVMRLTDKGVSEQTPGPSGGAATSDVPTR